MERGCGCGWFHWSSLAFSGESVVRVKIVGAVRYLLVDLALRFVGAVCAKSLEHLRPDLRDRFRGALNVRL